MWLSDWTNSRIRTVNMTSRLVTTFATTVGRPQGISSRRGIVAVSIGNNPGPVSAYNATSGSLIYTTPNVFMYPVGVAITNASTVYIGGNWDCTISQITSSGIVASLSGSSCSYLDGPLTSARFSSPVGIALSDDLVLYVADGANNRVRQLNLLTNTVSTLAGSGTIGHQDGVGTSASFSFYNSNSNLATDIKTKNVILADSSNNRVRQISQSGTVTTLSGSLSAGYADGFEAKFSYPRSVGIYDGRIYIGEQTAVRQLTCVPCPASYYCFSGVPVICPAGTYCPLSSTNATLCPLGSFSAAGSANCTLCPGGTFASSAGSTSCQQCPPGHYCPAGSMRWNDKNCGRGNYCPWGSSAPVSCGPKGAVDPALGASNGPAWLSDVAACRNHCYNGAPGQLSTCA